MKWRKPTYLKEIKMTKVSSKDKVLHIGCGILPTASVFIAEETNAKVVGIDNNNKTLKFAQQFVDKSGLSDLIKIEYGDGVDYPVESFNAIIVSGCSLPKIKILEHIFEGAKPQSKIIIREPSATTKSVIDCINMHQDIVPVNKMENNPFPFFGWQSFYLIKK